MLRLTTALICFALMPLTALAQSEDRANTILVLDGSGSMWGQIDGINKIVIAREVIADLLADLPDDAALGLTVYGHRERGSCSDIETVVAPGPFTQDAILEAVNSINPRGRTPMTDSVIAAAQALRHTEEAATVILVSDGIENCNPDPCAMAAELEAAGIAFTAHVIGFDVASEPEARAQMQCIADNTGGLFLTADNAEELSDALGTVVAAAATAPPPPPPPVVPHTVLIEARVQPSGVAPTRPVGWVLLSEAGEVLITGIEGPGLTTQLMPGSYIARATRAERQGPASYQTAFEIVGPVDGPIVVAMPEIVDTATVSFTARIMPDMFVPSSPLLWTLYDAAGGKRLGPVEAPSGTISLEQGDYRLVVERVSQGTLHEASFSVTAGVAQEVVIPLPALFYEVSFTARIGADDGPLVTDPMIWEVSSDTAEPPTSNPANLSLGRGAYVLTAYWTAQEIELTSNFVIVYQDRDIVVVFPEPAETASITAPATAVAGSTIEVGWSGPDGDGDLIGIGSDDASGSGQWRNYTQTAEGPVLSLLVPPEPGEHLIRYFNDERESLVSVPITVTPAIATITAPTTATAGSSVEIGWTGPNYDGDFVGIGPANASGSGQWRSYFNTADGNPGVLDMPDEPGSYVIRYFLSQDRTEIASVTIEVQ